MAHSQGKVVVTNAVAMDQADVDCIERIHAKGVEFDVRKVPADNPTPYDSVIKKAKDLIAAESNS
jgi:PTS system mannose-specific IIB component